MVKLCETFAKHAASKPQVDIYLIMDDIIEKLSLLDYENQFCKGWKHKLISRIHFAHKPEQSGKEEDVARVHLLYDMAYWLMSMDREKVSSASCYHPSQLLVPQTWRLRKL